MRRTSASSTAGSALIEETNQEDSQEHVEQPPSPDFSVASAVPPPSPDINQNVPERFNIFGLRHGDQRGQQGHMLRCRSRIQSQKCSPRKR